MMNKAITITARMKSQRLKLKAMRYISGKPMIEHMIDRLKMSEEADEIILCTSSNPQDKILIDVAEKKNIKHFRGSEEDVLKRLYNASLKNDIDYLCSTTADNPLTSTRHIDRMFRKLERQDSDYVTCKNLPIGMFSYGLDFSALDSVIKSKDESETEIWGRFFEENSSIQKADLEIDEGMRSPELRFTVDWKEDLILMRKIFDEFGPKNNFSLQKCIEYVESNEEVREINEDRR